MKRYYSVSEAEDIIPLIKPKILNLIKLSQAIELLDSVAIEFEDELETMKKDVAMNIRFHKYSYKFCKEVERLLEQGIVLRDLEDGVVNFLGLHNNKEIFLCWKVGEHKIDSWYETNSEYEFRKPVSELKQKKI
jgi:hypothetical protein